MGEADTTVALDRRHNAKKARQMGQLGLRQIVFSDQDLMFRWAFALEALAESQLSLCCRQSPEQHDQTLESSHIAQPVP